MKSAFNRSILALAAILVVAGAGQASAQDKPLKKYQSGTKEFWTHPPDDWFLGDETEAQKGLAPPSGPPTGASEAELAALMKKIKLPPGFKIEVYASGVLAARQMAWGDKGTLFVGSFGLGNVYAITDNGGKKEVKTILKGLNMPTGLAFRDGALYVIAVDKLIKYDNAEANLDKLGDGKVVYDDMPSYAAHGWKYLAADKDGWFYVPFGPPFNIGIPPTSVSQIRRVDPKTGNAELVALGVRNSVGGDVDPRTGKYWFTENARDWMSDDTPSDKLNMISKLGEHFGYPYCHQGDMPDPKFAMGHKCSEFTPPVLNLGAHVAPLGMKFYTGDQFPAEYKNSILIAEHGSWNRHKYQGARIVRVTVDPDGKNAKQEGVRIRLDRRRPGLSRPAGRHHPGQGRIDPRRRRLGRRDLSHQLQEVRSEDREAAVARERVTAASRFQISDRWTAGISIMRAPIYSRYACAEWRCRCAAAAPAAPPTSPPARKRPNSAPAVTAKTAFRKPRTFPRSRASPISSFSGSWFSSAAARARTSRCSRSSNRSTMTIFAISAPILPR